MRLIGITYLSGRTNYGDSIEDEWVVVYILRELTKRHSDIWVKVVDSDGEFLLIEAAGTLPAWLEPEVADNRVSYELDCPLPLFLCRCHADHIKHAIRYGFIKEISRSSNQSKTPEEKLPRNCPFQKHGTLSKKSRPDSSSPR